MSREKRSRSPDDSEDESKHAKKAKGAGKGKGPKSENKEIWEERLRDLPDNVQIICDEGLDPATEPLIVFIVPKIDIRVEHLMWLESLRSDSLGSPAYTHSSRKIAELLFGFKGIGDRREAIEQVHLEDDDCDDLELEMAKYPKPGAWFSEPCRAINPAVGPADLDADDIQVLTTLRMYRLRDFWEHFNDLAEPYSTGDGDDLAVVF